MSKAAPDKPGACRRPEPVDVVDGIPDRSGNRAAWKYVVLAVVFLAWIAFLIYCQIAAKPS